MRFKIDWAGLIVGSKFTVSLCFTLYLRAISKYKPSPGGGGGLFKRTPAKLPLNNLYNWPYEFGLSTLPDVSFPYENPLVLQC